MSPASPGYSLYLHIPFCRHKCSYCDFNTYAGLESLIGPYMRALGREAELVAESAPSSLPIQTIFFGGGTPSLVPTRDLSWLLAILASTFEVLEGTEITLEANPGTLSRPALQDIRALGVNRLSLGMQSAHPGDLGLMERQHSHSDVVRAVAWAREAGFEDLNLDLIFGLPGQTLERWKHTLDLAVGLGPDHLSLYGLSLEHGTPLNAWVGRGLVTEPDQDLAADMYLWADERLAEAGYQQYEISNWARRDSDGRWRTCRHNLQYWRNQPYLGLGAGAHGFAGRVRTANVLSPGGYIQRLEGGKPLPFPRTPATSSVVPIDPLTEMQETMLMGLRLTQEGVHRGLFSDRYGRDLVEVFGDQIDPLVAQGLLAWSGPGGGTLRLTPPGRLLGNQVFERFV